jgi:hypothetical protein
VIFRTIEIRRNRLIADVAQDLVAGAVNRTELDHLPTVVRTANSVCDVVIKLQASVDARPRCESGGNVIKKVMIHPDLFRVLNINPNPVDTRRTGADLVVRDSNV